jgi:hypothetical protein
LGPRDSCSVCDFYCVHKFVEVDHPAHGGDTTP